MVSIYHINSNLQHQSNRLVRHTHKTVLWSWQFANISRS